MQLLRGASGQFNACSLRLKNDIHYTIVMNSHTETQTLWWNWRLSYNYELDCHL